MLSVITKSANRCFIVDAFSKQILVLLGHNASFIWQQIKQRLKILLKILANPKSVWCAALSSKNPRVSQFCIPVQQISLRKIHNRIEKLVYRTFNEFYEQACWVKANIPPFLQKLRIFLHLVGLRFSSGGVWKHALFRSKDYAFWQHQFGSCFVEPAPVTHTDSGFQYKTFETFSAKSFSAVNAGDV